MFSVIVLLGCAAVYFLIPFEKKSNTSTDNNNTLNENKTDNRELITLIVKKDTIKIHLTLKSDSLEYTYENGKKELDIVGITLSNDSVIISDYIQIKVDTNKMKNYSIENKSKKLIIKGITNKNPKKLIWMAIPGKSKCLEGDTLVYCLKPKKGPEQAENKDREDGDKNEGSEKNKNEANVLKQQEKKGKAEKKKKPEDEKDDFKNFIHENFSVLN